MKTLQALINRNRKLFFRDRGMLFSSLITPVILIVLYATFLAKVYKDSFTSYLPKILHVSEKLIDGAVASQLGAGASCCQLCNSYVLRESYDGAVIKQVAQEKIL